MCSFEDLSICWVTLNFPIDHDALEGKFLPNYSPPHPKKNFIRKPETKHTSENGSKATLTPYAEKKKEMMMIWIVSIAFSSSFSRNWNVNKWEEIYWTKTVYDMGSVWWKEKEMLFIWAIRAEGNGGDGGKERKRKNCIRNGRN